MIGNIKDFLTLEDFSGAELTLILDTADKLKSQRNLSYRPLLGRTLAMIFSKSSTRTRVSFEAGIYQLGGMGLYLNASDIQLGRGETITDTAKVLERYVDAAMIRTYKYSDVVELARNSKIPVINGLTDYNHPCQAMADFMTFREKKGRLAGLKMAYIGDGNNVAHSLALGACKLGIKLDIASPEGYQCDAAVKAKCDPSLVRFINDPKQAVESADAVYTDVWVSMGQEAEKEKRLSDLQKYQVDSRLMSLAKNDAIFLHCLPAHRGEEVSAEVIDGKNSAVFDQAENRLHAQKAIMVLLMNGELP